MGNTALKKEALRRIQDIHKLSQTYNSRLKNNHTVRLLALIKEHADEIYSLYSSKDSHYLIEVGDLILLCFEILLENNTSLDETLINCFQRYEKKLPRLIKEVM